MTAPQTPASQTELVAEIRTYLRLNPSAGDTAVGIWQCWLKRTRNRTDEASVAGALEHLVAQDDLQARRLTTGELFYFGRQAPRRDSESLDKEP